MDVLLGQEILKEAKEVLDGHGVEYWLNFGTLLGAVREGAFIGHDDNEMELHGWNHKLSLQTIQGITKSFCDKGYDAYYSTLADYISIWKKGFNVAFSMYTLNGDKAERPVEDIYGSGFKMAMARYIFWLSEIFSIRRAGTVNMETFKGLRRTIKFALYYLSTVLPEPLRRILSIKLRFISMKIGGEFGKTRIPAKYYQNLSNLKFYGMTFRIPAETEKYLEFIYGSNWRIPIKDWKFYDKENRSQIGLEMVHDLWDYESRL